MPISQTQRLASGVKRYELVLLAKSFKPIYRPFPQTPIDLKRVFAPSTKDSTFGKNAKFIDTHENPEEHSQTRPLQKPMEEEGWMDLYPVVKHEKGYHLSGAMLQLLVLSC